MTHLRERTLVVGVAVLVVAALAPPGTAGTLGGPVGVQEADAPRFVDAPYREHRGDVVLIPVALPNGTTTATVTVKGNGTDYASTLSLHDGSGDGRVTLVWNTYLAGAEPPNATFRAAAAGDTVAVRNSSLVVGRLDGGTYDLRVATGPDATPADRTTLTLAADRNATATVLTAAGERFANLTSLAEVSAARRSGALARPPAVTLGDGRVRAVVPGDLVVFEVHAPGLAGAFATAEGPNETARFRAVLGRAFRLRLVEHRATIQVHEDAAVAGLGNATRRRVVADPANDTYYALVDTGAPVSTNPDNDAFTEDGEAYVVVASYPPFAESRYDARDKGSAVVQFVQPPVSVAVSTPTGPNGTVTVAGTAGVPLGSEVVVRLRGDSTSLPVERRARVEADGRFEATFRLPSLSANASFDAVVRHDGEPVVDVPATAPPAATLDLEDAVSSEQGIRRPLVDSVEATHGGFVVVRRGSADGPVVGVTGLLAPGEHHDVHLATVEPVVGNATLVGVVHRDVDADGAFDPAIDAPYPGADPVDRASFVDFDATPTPTATATPTLPTPSPTPTATPTRTETPPGHSDIYGFGVVVAVVALAAAIVGVRAERSRPGGGDA